MSKEQYEQFAEKLQAIKKEIEALPESSNNGLLIDAALCMQNASERLRRYFMLKQNN